MSLVDVTEDGRASRERLSPGDVRGRGSQQGRGHRGATPQADPEVPRVEEAVPHRRANEDLG